MVVKGAYSRYIPEPFTHATIVLEQKGMLSPKSVLNARVKVGQLYIPRYFIYPLL